MSTSSETPWYRLGYALEAARRKPSSSRLQQLGERLAAFRDEGKDDERPRRRPAGRADRSDRDLPAERDGAEVFDQLVIGGGAALVVRLLRAWPARGRAGWGEITRGALAGAGATLLRELTAPLLRGRIEAPSIDDRLAGRLLSGAARGALFGGFVEPRLPGSPILKGVVYGSVEYLTTPYGGLPKLLGSVAPWSRLPLLEGWIAESPTGEDSYLEHLVFGIALALMAGAAVDLTPLLDDFSESVEE